MCCLTAGLSNDGCHGQRGWCRQSSVHDCRLTCQPDCHRLVGEAAAHRLPAASRARRRDPFCETLSYLVVAGVVFSWTPEAGAFGSAGLNLDQSAQDKPVATQEDDEVGTSTVATTQQKTQLGNLTAVVEVASWIVFVVGFILFVQNIVSPGGVLCVDGVAGAGGSALEPGDLLSLDAADMAADLR